MARPPRGLCGARGARAAPHALLGLGVPGAPEPGRAAVLAYAGRLARGRGAPRAPRAAALAAGAALPRTLRQSRQPGLRCPAVLAGAGARQRRIRLFRPGSARARRLAARIASRVELRYLPV